MPSGVCAGYGMLWGLLMRDITAQLDSYQDHLDSLYPPVTPDEVYDLDREASRVTTTGGSLRPRLIAFAATFAVIVALGVIGLLIGSGEPTDPADDPPSPVSSTVSAPTTSVPPPATTTPIPAPSTTLAEQPMVTTPPPTTLADGTTMLASLVPLGSVEAAIDAEGRLVAAYWAKALVVVRCEERDCRGETRVATVAEAPSFQQEGETVPGVIVGDIALRSDDSPIIVASHPQTGSATVYVCSDPVCTSVRRLDFGGQVRLPQLVIAPDGLVRIVYVEGSSGQLKLATCGDPLCETGIASTITIDEAPIPTEPSIEIDSEGQIIVGYTVEVNDGSTEARVAVCRDDSCSGEPVTFQNAATPRISTSQEGGFNVWYRSGPWMLGEGDAPEESAVLDAWDLMMADCDSAGCGEATRIDTDWRLLWSWTGHAHLHATPDGTVAVAYQHFSSEVCSQLVNMVTLEIKPGSPSIDLGSYQPGGYLLDTVTRDESVLLISTGDDGRLRLREVSSTDPGNTSPSPVPQCASP